MNLVYRDDEKILLQLSRDDWRAIGSIFSMLNVDTTVYDWQAAQPPVSLEDFDTLFGLWNGLTDDPRAGVFMTRKVKPATSH